MKKGTIAVLSTVLGGAIGAAVVGRNSEKTKTAQRARTDKFYGYFQVLNQWLAIKNEGKSLVEYFYKNGYKKIAIYGIGELGNRLVEELRGTDIKIEYVIDKKQDFANTDLPILTVEDATEVDVIVVTPIFAYDEIEGLLMDHLDYPVVSLEEVVCFS